ncbi:MAG: hypothetical protein AB7P04_03065 [Bacteriovoracia bacterium]
MRRVFFINKNRTLNARSGVLAILLLALTNPALASTVAIPQISPGSPANDLVYQGRVLDRDEALDLAKKRRVDLSQLDPEEHDAWQDRAYDYSSAAWADLPGEGATVDFDSYLTSTNELFRSRARFIPDSGPYAGENRMLRVTITLEGHAAIMRAAMMRALGYPVALPRNYRNLTFRFVDNAKRDSFLNAMSDATHTARDRWIVNLPDNQPEVTLRDVTLESGQVDTPPYHWGVITKDKIRSRRSLRAILLPITLLDLSERINLYSWNYAEVTSGHLIFNHPFAESFSEVSQDDLKWIARKIARFTRPQLQAIVNAGQYPADISALILEKLVSRRNQMAKVLGLKKERVSDLPFNASLNTGAVKNGKLTQSAYPGYAMEFVYPDPESPLKADEIARFGLLEGITSALARGASELNEKLLTVQSVQDVAEKHQKDTLQRIINHYMSNPTEPYQETVRAWGGPIGGFNVNASRNVVTGTYYGSDAQVQLLDNVAVQGSIGYYLGISGVDKMLPSGSANLSLQRNYLHVRPVGDMKEALKTKWSWLFVPSFFKHLDRLLEKGAKVDADGNAQAFLDNRELTETEATGELDDSEKNFKAFLDELKEGEIFSVTDTVLAGARAQVTIPLASLLGLGPIGYANSIDISGGVTGMILRRTLFVRTEEGIQVYLQRVNTRSADIGVDLRWWITLMSYNHTWKHSEAKTKAFLLDQGERTPEQSKKLVIALRALLRRNNAEVLEQDFKPFRLDHTLDASIDKFKFLFWSWHNIEETHLVKVKPPVDPQDRYNPDDHVRSLLSYRIVKANGADGYSFVSDVVSEATEGWGFKGKSGGNPANSFLGSGRWSVYASEKETTPGRDNRAVIRVEHHWGGWLLPRKEFFSIVEGLERKAAPLNLERPLINREVFGQMKQLQLYDIQQILVVYDQGTQRLRDTLFQGGLRAIYDRLVEIAGGQAVVDDFCERERIASIGENYSAYNGYSEKENGNRVRLKCTLPWMRTVLKFRHEYPANDAEKQLKWNVKLIRTLERELPLDQLLGWLQKDGYYFQIHINGFRKGDENDDMAYASDTIGTIDDKMGSGIFREFSNNYKIFYYEIAARYLTEGF